MPRSLPGETRAKVLAALRALAHEPEPGDFRRIGKQFGASERTVKRWWQGHDQDALEVADTPSNGNAAAAPTLIEPLSVETVDVPVEGMPDLQPTMEESVGAVGPPGGGPMAPASNPAAEELTKALVKGVLVPLANASMSPDGLLGSPPEAGPPKPPEPITPKEEDALTHALTPVMVKYNATGTMGAYAPEIIAILVVAGIFVPRIMQARAYHAYYSAQRELAPANVPQPRPQAPPGRLEDHVARQMNARFGAVERGGAGVAG